MKDPGELYYPPLRWHEQETDTITINESIISSDFLTGKIPNDLPKYWEEEE